MSSVQICTFYVKGLASKSKRDPDKSWFNQQRFSFVFLQETHCISHTDDVNKSSSKLNGKCNLSGNSTKGKVLVSS